MCHLVHEELHADTKFDTCQEVFSALNSETSIAPLGGINIITASFQSVSQDVCVSYSAAAMARALHWWLALVGVKERAAEKRLDPAHVPAASAGSLFFCTTVLATQCVRGRGKGNTKFILIRGQQPAVWLSNWKLSTPSTIEKASCSCFAFLISQEHSCAFCP